MYSLITSGMTWSYSRISCFNSCPYKFFLTYVKPCEKVPLFFSDYGSFMHELLAGFYGGQKTKEDLIREYLTGFRSHVVGKAPSQKIFTDYFQQGLAHLKSLTSPSKMILGVEKTIEKTILGVEKKVFFSVQNYSFIGFIDLLLQNEESKGITLVDHKSRALKPRSKSGKVTKSDERLDSYLRQLYLYSIPVIREYGVLPSHLSFNCYRTGQVIREPFSLIALEEAKEWASQSIEAIIREEDFNPNMDYYYCRHICDVHDSCEYYALK